MKNLTRRDCIDAAVAAVTAGGIAYDHSWELGGDRKKGAEAMNAARKVAWLLGEDDVDVDAVTVHIDILREAVPLAGGLDICIAEKIQTIEGILCLPLTPLPTATPKVPA